MTLTEQYKKGELKRGMYWVVVDADGDRSIQPCVYGSEFDDFEEVADEDLSFITAGNINQREHCSICWEEVLAPIPSYEEWRSTGKFAMEAMKVAEENQQLKEENAQLRKFLEEFNALEVAKENQQLKELLKECEEVLLSYSNINGDYELYDKITNAIGEKK